MYIGMMGLFLVSLLNDRFIGESGCFNFIFASFPKQIKLNKQIQTLIINIKIY